MLVYYKIYQRLKAQLELVKAQLEQAKIFNVPHPLNNFEIQKYYQNEPKFHSVYSRNNLPKIKDGAYVINLDEFKSIRIHWIDLYVNGNNVKYFDSFEHIPKGIEKFIGGKYIIANIYRIQAYSSTMCGYFCIGFIVFYVKKQKFARLYKFIFS